MPKFGEKSKEKLETCHQDLQKLFNEVIKYFDCCVICGHRTEEEQDEAFKNGHSNVEYPNSKHNQKPSLAVDVVPYPIDWKDTNRFYLFVGFVRGIAAMLDIPIRCGGDWDGDLETSDQKLTDLPHFEMLTSQKSDTFFEICRYPISTDQD